MNGIQLMFTLFRASYFPGGYGFPLQRGLGLHLNVNGLPRGVGLVGRRDKASRAGGIGAGLRREKDGEGRTLPEEEGMGEDVD